MDYLSLSALAGSLGYREFTALQQAAFSDPAARDPNKNLLVIGPTSSGKTLVPMLLYYERVRQAQRARQPYPKLLFVVPYRALAAQKSAELAARFNAVYGREAPLTAVQSTGEYRQDDEIIRHAQADISVIISEKAFLFACEDRSFLEQFDEVVFDEIGLLADEGRGVKLDFLLAWCCHLQQAGGRPHVTMLGTPFYDWSAYAAQFRFTVVRADSRPTLLERPLFVSGSGSGGRTLEYPRQEDAEPPLPAMCRMFRHGANGKPVSTTGCPRDPARRYACPVDTPCRQDPEAVCPRTGAPCAAPVLLIPPGISYRACLIARLCRWHLARGHQVLVFWNNREEVRQLAIQLYRLLADVLPPPPPLAECKAQVLAGCSSQIHAAGGTPLGENGMSEDELFGILEDEHYLAFCSGIGFHSAALPNELRGYVEQAFLESRRLQIVCSTETLAYGVNSAVDAVIIADMAKTVQQDNLLLTANEYQNYVGRAGRLREGARLSEIVGWVHPILNCRSERNPRFDPADPRYRHWQMLRDSARTPETMYSRIFERKNSFVPFMLLCLLPTDPARAMARAELQEWLAQLPRPESAARQPADPDAALDFLLRAGLAASARRTPAGARYYVTERGAQVRGYTPSTEDYLRVTAALGQAFRPDPADPAAPPVLQDALLIYHLLDARCLEAAVFGLGREMQDPAGRAQAALRTPETLRQMLQGLPVWPGLAPLLDSADLTDPRSRCKCMITAAVLCWADSTNLRRMHNLFGVPYPLIQSLTQEMSFLMDIAAHSTYCVPRMAGEAQAEYEARQSAAGEAVLRLSRSIYFGIQRSLYERMMRFFAEKQEMGSPESARIFQSLKNPQPSMARQLRRITSYYRLLLDQQNTDPHLGIQRMQARKAIRKLGSLWVEFFTTAQQEERT